MSPSGVRVGVDIGNTAAKWSVCRDDNGQPPAVQRARLSGSDWPEQLARSVDQLTSDGVRSWRIAAVNAPARDRLLGHLAATGDLAGVQVITHKDVPIKARVSQPARVGIDRLLAIWRATKLFPGQRVVVVDAGSAITIDCANPAGEFLGGVILPGLSLQFDSLARGTDALPAIEPAAGPESCVDLQVPATDTVSAIRSGIMLGTAAAIDALVVRSHGGQSHQLILTGGDASRLSPLLTTAHHLLQSLVTDALLQLP